MTQRWAHMDPMFRIANATALLLIAEAALALTADRLPYPGMPAIWRGTGWAATNAETVVMVLLVALAARHGVSAALHGARSRVTSRDNR